MDVLRRGFTLHRGFLKTLPWAGKKIIAKKNSFFDFHAPDLG